MADSRLREPRRQQNFYQRRNQPPQRFTADHFGTSICPFDKCNYESSTRNQFFMHIYRQHSQYFVNLQNFRQMIELFASSYFLIDTQVSYERFAHVCKLCQKHVGSSNDQRQVETTAEEDEAHLFDHFAVPEYVCTECHVWFNSQASSERHEQSSHGEYGFSCTNGCLFFTVGSNSLKAWEELTNDLKETRNLSFAQKYGIVYEHTERQPLPASEANELIHNVMRNERNLKSLAELKGFYLEVFKSIGDKNFIGSMIMAASDKTIKLCCSEVENNILEMLVDKHAASALVSLLMRSPDNFWNIFVDVVHRNRTQTYNSPYSAHAIRRLMTTVVNEKPLLSDRRANSLCNAFFTLDSIDTDMISSQYAGYFFMSVAMREGRHSQSLARHFTVDSISLAKNRFTNLAYRILIKTALKNPDDEDNHAFITKTASIIQEIYKDSNGVLVAQSIIFNAPNYCQAAIIEIRTINWIFEHIQTGQPRFKHHGICHLIQTVIVVSQPSDVYHLASSMTEFEVDQLLRDRNGNNILRRMAEMMVDYTKLKLFYDLVFDVNSKLRQNNAQMDFAKSCAQIIFRRMKIVEEQEKAIAARRG